MACSAHVGGLEKVDRTAHATDSTGTTRDASTNAFTALRLMNSRPPTLSDGISPAFI
jgi:hypothetical protein